MSVARLNELQAKEGCGDALREFLRRIEPVSSPKETARIMELLLMPPTGDYFHRIS